MLQIRSKPLKCKTELFSIATYFVAVGFSPHPEETLQIKMNATAARTDETLESAKKLQILEGARRCFLAQGFDGASMNDIVQAAGVSKGTVYAHFLSKEKLFEALVFHDRRLQAEQVIVIEHTERPIDQVLNDLGLRMVKLFTAPESISYVRTVVAVSGKFPDIGRSFYAAGPAYAIQIISAYLKTKMEDGTLRQTDAEIAAMQFIELVQCGQVKPRLFAVAETESLRSHEMMVASAVQLFLGGLAARRDVS
jgi:AcrR family transcriptional regulator